MIIAHQETLEGMPADSSNRRMAAARLFTPHEHGLSEQKMMAQRTPHEMRAAWPDNFYPNLVGRQVILSNEEGRGKQAIFFHSRTGPTKLALAGHERLTYGYSLGALGDRAHIVAQEAPDGKYKAGDEDAPNRAGIHSIDSKIVAMEAYLGVLSSQKEILGKFVEALERRHIGLARFGGEKQMRAGYDMLVDVIIATMLDALEDQRGWDSAKKGIANQTIKASLLADRAGNRHLAYAYRLCSMLRSYGNVKIDAFTRKKESGEIAKKRFPLKNT